MHLAPGRFSRPVAAMPPIMRESVEALIDGMPFDADQERKRAIGWR